jgi:hypothetical protein
MKDALSSTNGPADREAHMLQQQESHVTQLEERIVVERERAELLKKQMACGCPDRCDIDHDN